MRSRSIAFVVVCALITLAAEPARAQNVEMQGTDTAFASRTITSDGITLTLDVESAGLAVPVVKRNITVKSSPCSARRACGPTFDLRVLSVAAPTAIAAGVPAPISFVIDNAGRTPAPAFEVTICRVGRRGCAGGPSAIVTLPELAPGQIVEVTQPVTLNSFDQESEITFAVIADADAMLAEKNAKNNGKTAPTATLVEGWKIEKMDETKPEKHAASYQHGGVTFSMKIRNASALAPSPMTPFDLAMGDEGKCSAIVRHIALPSIPPRAIVTVTMTTPSLSTGCTQIPRNRSIAFAPTTRGVLSDIVEWDGYYGIGY